LADRADRLAFPGHFERREAPTRVAWNALVGRASDQREVPFGVAARAIVPRDADTGFAPRHRRQVLVAVVALQRMIAGRVAVHAARMGHDLGDLVEQRARALRLVADARERGE